MRRFACLLVLAFAALPAQPAAGDLLLPPRGEVFSGMSGGWDLSGYTAEVGRRPDVFGGFTMVGQPNEHIFRAAQRTDTRPMLHVGTQRYFGGPQVVTPLGMARGGADGYLVGLNRRLSVYGKPAYIRLMAEMNQANNGYSAFDRDGRPRGRTHSTRAFIAAWRRATLVLRGGSVARIDRRLRRLGLPPVAADATALPRPPIAMAWVPQTEGSPAIHANRARAYWPGRRYVDWVGTDFYSKFPNFDKLERFYRDFPGMPMVFGEWAMWGRDDPGFVRRLFAWIRSHRRVRMVLYNQGADADAPFRLRRYPQSRRAIAQELARPLFGR